MMSRDTVLVLAVIAMVILSLILSLIISMKISTLENLPGSSEGIGKPFQEKTIRNISSQLLSLEGFRKVEVIVVPGVITLTSNCTSINMNTLPTQTYSIFTGMNKIIEDRPTIHDVAYDMLSSLGGDILVVKIVKFEEDAYFADLVVKLGNKTVALDSKPSDAIALAVRSDAEVYIDNQLLEKYGIGIC